MEYINDIEFNLNEFEEVLSGLNNIFENETIGQSIDNANRKPMNNRIFETLEGMYC